MASNVSTNFCGLPYWVPIPANDTVSRLNEIIAASVNAPLCVFAFLSNLAIILAVSRTPALQTPCNILLCSLASADCLTGAIAQPNFVATRLILLSAHQSCSFVLGLHKLREITIMLICGLSFVSASVISFDRHHALSRPLLYRANATKQGAVKVVLYTSSSWIFFTILITFVLPASLSYVLYLIVGVLMFVVPVVNHVRIIFAIRRNNRVVQDAVAAQHLSAILQREKRVAKDMFIVTILLFATLTPVIAITIFFESTLHDPLFPWAYTMVYLNSSVNPTLLLSRNKGLQRAVKSLFFH